MKKRNIPLDAPAGYHWHLVPAGHLNGNPRAPLHILALVPPGWRFVSSETGGRFEVISPERPLAPLWSLSCPTGDETLVYPGGSVRWASRRVLRKWVKRLQAEAASAVLMGGLNDYFRR